MQSFNLVCFVIMVPFLIFMSSIVTVCKGLDCINPKKVTQIIRVDSAGKENFTSVQAAIDFIPKNNNRWILVQISAGTYKEKVEVPVKKPCIVFQGAGRRQTSIEWDDHDTTNSSSTVSIFAENILVKGITFKNTYNLNVRAAAKVELKQAVAVRVEADKVAFYGCGFYGVQDTLWDREGRHYFTNCYIEGSIDFIFGRAQSVYEKCEIFVNIGKYVPGLLGTITAQKKEWLDEESGFVFKLCVIHGIGQALLGRAWGPYSTVLIDRSNLSNVVSPQGWTAWNYAHHERNFTFEEVNNFGPGANTSRRVRWINKLQASQLQKYLDISYIDADGWIGKLPQ